MTWAAHRTEEDEVAKYRKRATDLSDAGTTRNEYGDIVVKGRRCDECSAPALPDSDWCGDHAD